MGQPGFFDLDDRYQRLSENDVELEIPKLNPWRIKPDPVSGRTDGVIFNIDHPIPGVDSVSTLLHDRKSVNKFVPLMFSSIMTDALDRTDLPRTQDLMKPAFVLVLKKLMDSLNHTKNYNYYVDGQPGEWTDFISCNTAFSVPFPRCILYFEHRNLDVKIDFVSKWLPEWKNIKEFTETYLECIYVPDRVQ